MYYTVSGTATYTVVDIRRAFEGFESDVRMIARLTGCWSMDYVEKVYHDVVKLAEAKYLKAVNIVQETSDEVPIRAAKFVVNSAGTGMSSERPGGNNWAPVAGSRLSVVVEYTTAWHALTAAQQSSFHSNNSFQIGWVKTGLRQSSGQLYASNGYELQKLNYN
jgi:hypothetical protein